MNLKKLLDIIENIFTVLSCLIILWFILSWIDVAWNNIGDNPQYHSWNLFVLMVNYLLCK